MLHSNVLLLLRFGMPLALALVVLERVRSRYAEIGELRIFIQGPITMTPVSLAAPWTSLFPDTGLSQSSSYSYRVSPGGGSDDPKDPIIRPSVKTTELCPEDRLVRCGAARYWLTACRSSMNRDMRTAVMLRNAPNQCTQARQGVGRTVPRRS